MTSPARIVIDEGFAGVSGRRIRYLRAGSGPAVVLLHSSAQTADVFRAVILALAGFTAIAPDIAGFGGSDPRGARAMPAYGDDVLELLDDLAIERAHLVGLHTGNKIAAAVATDYPERVATLVLVGMSHSIIPDREDRNQAMVDYLGHRPGTNSGDSADPRQPPGYDAMYDANFAYDWGEHLGAVTCPTLVAELVPPSQAHVPRQADTLARIIPDCHTTEFGESDRDLLLHHPDRLAAAVSDFVRAKVGVPSHAPREEV